MTRQRRRIDRLVWLRNLRRTQAVSALAAAQRTVSRAEQSEQHARAHARESAEALDRLTRAGIAAASLRAAGGGLAAARNAIRSAHSQTEAARLERALKRREAEQADRRKRAAELADERIAAEERRSAARAEQKRIDETAARRTRIHPLWVGSLLAIATTLAPLPGASAGPAKTTEAQATADTGRGSQLEMAFSRIRVRHAELDRRERELIDRERKLIELEATAAKRLRELEEISREVELRIAAWEEVDEGQSLSRLSRIYASMPAQQAAPLIQSLDIGLATQIVAKMKPKQSSALIALLSPDRAREMSERIAHPLSMKPVGKETPG